MTEKIPGAKVCGSCKVMREFGAFPPDRTKKYGLSSRCRECALSYGRAYRSKYRERINANGRRRRLENPRAAAERDRRQHFGNHAARLESQRKWRAKNKEYFAQWAARNSARRKATARKRRDRDIERHREKAADAQRRHRADNPELRSLERAYNRQWSRSPGGIARRAQRRQCTPACLPAAQLAAVVQVTLNARDMSRTAGAPYEVDHIIPVKGLPMPPYLPENNDSGVAVSGLNVPWNLQVLPRMENNRKRNRGWQETAAALFRSEMSLLNSAAHLNDGCPLCRGAKSES